MKRPTLLLIAISISLFQFANAAECDTISERNWEPLPFAVKAGTSIVVNVAITNSLKAIVDETRPNGEDNNSMCSAHASWAFTGASILAHELYSYSGWWAVGSHAIANGFSIQRTFSETHYPKDILVGALSGIVSGEIGYLVGNLIFPSSKTSLPSNIYADWLPGVDVVTTAMMPFTGGSALSDAGTSVAISARFNMPMSDNWGFCLGPTVRSMPLYAAGGSYTTMVDAAGAFAGGVLHASLPWSRWSFEGRAMPGFVKNFDAKGVAYPSWSFIFDATAGLDCRLTHNFNVGGEVGYGFWHMRRNVSAITIGLYSRATF